MLALRGRTCQSPTWRDELAAAFTSGPDLLRHLDLDPESLPTPLLIRPDFAIRVPRSFAALMRPGDAGDPLLRQVLPIATEHAPQPGFTTDPLGETAARTAPGLLHKYQGRVLLLVTGACAVHCRFCFRRHRQDAEATASHQLEAAIARIAADGSINEVILSGGDPLLLDDGDLARLIDRLTTIPHLRRLRVHTRLPVALPSRVDADLCRLLAGTRLQALIVIHANHARELGEGARSALGMLGRHGIPVLNQSVLLRGVNDAPERLARLAERLFASGALPYYLHQLDPVHGAAHFAVSDERAAGIMNDLRARLPGYLVPRLVREESGRPAKTPLP